ncbi:MAG: permease [Notoacmeibacter sp.]|nr:permease [Notoacmeibacter sp.]
MSDVTMRPEKGFRLRPWIANPWAVTLSIPVLVAIFDPGRFAEIVAFALGAFGGTLPYIAAAVVMIAWLKASGAESVIGRVFEGRENRAILLAALFGGLAPFCSCQVIPFIAGLLALGTPLSVVMAFWLSSPLIDPPTLLITAAALGWNFAIAKAVAAVGIGLAGGFAVKIFAGTRAFADPARERKSGGCSKRSPFGGTPVWRFWSQPERISVFRAEFRNNALFLIKWLAMAYVLEALLISYVPASLVAGVVGGDGSLSIVIAAIVGMPAYLNSYVAPPLLAGLMAQGMSQGAAMAFMVAGAVSSVPAMAAVWSLVKPRVFAAYLGLGVAGAIVSGILFQLVT